LKNISSLTIFLLFISANAFAQFAGQSGNPDGLMLLRNDTIFQLNYRSDGFLEFIPKFKAPYLDSIGALSFWEEDSNYYGIRYDNAHIVRFQENGRYEDLGKASDSLEKDLPNDDLSSAVIHKNELFVLAYSTNSIYAINLEKRPLEFRVLTKNIGFSLPNTLAYNPRSEKLYILDQNGSPIEIDPKTGAVELPLVKGTFLNFPRKKLLSYGKLWFSIDGRCFLLAGQEGTLYELDTEKRIAFIIANIGFNSPKDAVAGTGLIVPDFIQKDLLNLKVQPYPHMSDILELEWLERNDNKEIAYYYTERFNPNTQIWEEIAFIPGYASTKQANRYTTMDRMPHPVQNCYRLRIVEERGYLRYSQVVCYDKNKSTQLKLSLPIVDFNSNQSLLHVIGFSGKKLDIKLYHPCTNEQCWTKNVEIQSEDQSIQIPLPDMGGWFELRIFEGAEMYRLKIFRLI
jgi:hypothetical protein